MKDIRLINYKNNKKTNPLGLVSIPNNSKLPYVKPCT